MKLAACLTSAVMLALATAPAWAHDDYDRHARDHTKHWKYHYYTDRAHARAHREGFDSWEDHRDYHRWLRHKHRHFHYRHPGTGHDHYEWRRY